MSEDRRGILFGIAAYGIWGLFPLYWPLLEPANSGEILLHRCLWSLVAVGLVLAVRRHWSWVRPMVADRRRVGLLALAACAIAVNWGVYIYGVNSHHVVETSLGYFINPLVTVALGVVVLGETLRPVQWAAIGLAVVAVGVLTVGYGRPPWIALILAFSFGTYGLIKKQAAVGAVESLTVETAVSFVPALAFLVALGLLGHGTFTSEGPGHAALLASSGIVTAIPLLFFGAAAIRVPLTTIGLLQYLAPVFQFLIGITVNHEHMQSTRWVGFVLVWVALVMLTGEALRTARMRQIEAAAECLT
jgi:chloramphenicol-sensitive protein RarD